MRKILVVLVVGLSFFVMSAAAQANDAQYEIKKELVSALKENREMRTEAFSKEELEKFFAPAFSTSEEQIGFFNSIDDRLPKKRGILISVKIEQHSFIDGGPTLTFEMEQPDHFKCIKVLKEGVVLYSETAPGSLRVQQ
jgi:hypothetical protein